jgi:hypothetical protein
VSNHLNSEIKRIELFDLSGRVIRQWNRLEFGENVLQIESILPGVYLLKAETEFGINTEKLVVQ